METNNNWLGAPPQALGVAAYLLVVVVVALFGLFQLFPENDLTQPIAEKNIKTFSTPDSSIMITGSFTPDISSTLTDSVTLNIQVEQNGIVDSTTSGQVVKKTTNHALILPRNTIPNLTLLWLIIIVGALGASIHGITSLAEYVGNEEFRTQWTMWYLFRPFVGGLLAIVFYWFLRAGIFQIETTDELYGILALAGLIGLFSKQALYKISDLVEVLFLSNKENRLKDKLTDNPKPEIKEVIPANLTLKTTDQRITIVGTNFIQGAKVTADDEELETIFESSIQLAAVIPTALLQEEKELQIQVHNPAPGGGASKALAVPIIGEEV